MNAKTLIAAVLALGGLVGGGVVSAASYCSDYAPGSHPDDLTVNGVKLDGTPSDDCYGVVLGNVQSSSESNDTINDLVNQDGDPWYDADQSWLFAASDDGPIAVVFQTIEFAISEVDPGTAGDFLLTWKDLDVGNPLDYDFGLDLLFAVKASDRYALYFFDDVQFTSDATGDGHYIVEFCKPNPNDATKCNIPGLSHLNLYLRQGLEVPTSGPLPEPGTVGLLGMGLIAGLFAYRRRRQTAA